MMEFANPPSIDFFSNEYIAFIYPRKGLPFSHAFLIFITNMARYAIRGYEVEALDFVLKPVSYEQFYMKMQKAVFKTNNDNTVNLVTILKFFDSMHYYRL